jgi:hypothetical protein
MSSTGKRIAFLVVLLVAAVFVLVGFDGYLSHHKTKTDLVTTQAYARPLKHHHAYKAGCNSKEAGWNVKEDPISIGHYIIRISRCWNAKGQLTSHGIHVTMQESKVGIAAGYDFVNDDSYDSKSDDRYVDYIVENHAQLCVSHSLISRTHPHVKLCAFYESWDSQPIIFSPAWVAHLNTEAPGAKGLSIDPPFESPADQKGFGLSFHQLPASELP